MEDKLSICEVYINEYFEKRSSEFTTNKQNKLPNAPYKVISSETKEII